MQPLDWGIILSVKRRYKKKLAKMYFVRVENNKGGNALLKSLDIVTSTNTVATSWTETCSAIIQNCFHTTGFKHYSVDPATQPERPPVAPASDVWNEVQRWMDVDFDDFAASEPETSTTQPMMDEEIVDLVCTENDTQQGKSEGRRRRRRSRRRRKFFHLLNWLRAQLNFWSSLTNKKPSWNEIICQQTLLNN